MKKLRILNIVLAFLALVSCTDLEEHPVDLMPLEGSIKTAKDVQLILNGAIGRIAADDYWGREMSVAIGLRSDMTDIGNRGTVIDRIQINDLNEDAFNGMIARFWPASYRIIGTANVAIEMAKSLGSNENKNELIAEGIFLKAFTYFNLVRLFGDIPYIDEAVTDLEAIEKLRHISKTPAPGVYRNIINDLEYAKEYLPLMHPQNARSRPSKGSVFTMLADVQLTLGNWQEAYNNAKWVIDNASILNYGLEPDYQDLFVATKQDGMPEHIFVIDFKGLESAWPQNVDSHPAFTGVSGSEWNGWDVMVPSMATYDSWDDRDYRKKVAFQDSLYFGEDLKPYTEWGIPRPHIAKYRRFPGVTGASGNESDNNYAIYRYAEVLLIAAEALNEIVGPTVEALSYVNQVRERARNRAGTQTDFPVDVQAEISKDDFRDLILEERRLELSFEFKRWWDIKRRQLGEEVFKGTNSLEPHDNFNSTKYLFPIPQDELDRNPNLLPQNPGY